MPEVPIEECMDPLTVKMLRAIDKLQRENYKLKGDIRTQHGRLIHYKYQHLCWKENINE